MKKITAYLIVILFVFSFLNGTFSYGQNTSTTPNPQQTVNTPPTEVERDEKEYKEYITRLQRRIQIQENENKIEQEQIKRITWIASGFLSLLSFAYSVFTFFHNSSKDNLFVKKAEYNIDAMLEAYHNQALSELRWNTNMGRAMAVLGLGIIFLGVFLCIIGITPALVGGLSLLSGVVMEGVSILFYKESAAARLRANEIQKDLYRLKAAKTIKDEKKRDAAISRIVDYYLIPDEKYGTNELSSENSKLLESDNSKNKPRSRRFRLETGEERT